MTHSMIRKNFLSPAFIFVVRIVFNSKTFCTNEGKKRPLKRINFFLRPNRSIYLGITVICERNPKLMERRKEVAKRGIFWLHCTLKWRYRTLEERRREEEGSRFGTASLVSTSLNWRWRKKKRKRRRQKTLTGFFHLQEEKTNERENETKRQNVDQD